MLSSTAQLMPYTNTGMFKDLVLDYLNKNQKLKSVYEHEVSIEGISKAIEQRKGFKTNRQVLVDVFKSWYHNHSHRIQIENIESLLSENTFTICTAHQPNIFTGYLYFVYKILHIIRIAEDLNREFPDKKFVPVFYMGSEDNDLEELGQVKVDGVKRTWQTKQKGAVGRMLVDQGLLQVIAELEGQLSVLPFGKELIQKLKTCYCLGENISQATFKFVNFLFEKYGLLVLIADDVRFKVSMTEIFKEDILTHSPFHLVNETGNYLMEHYSVQVNPREINLFYLDGDIRERIVKKGESYAIEQNQKTWSKDALLKELQEHPDRFSPNVVLRALYQEIILPNIVFVGGGAEVSYWLELKKMMQHFKVPYPVIVLRNSFLLADHSIVEKIETLGFSLEDLFMNSHQLMQKFVKVHATFDVELSAEKSKLNDILSEISRKNELVDKSLLQHIAAVQKKVLNMMDNVEKKMLRAAKRRFIDQQRQLEALKAKLFPSNSLQERTENILFFYALYGPGIIDEIYKNSYSMTQEFCMITLDQ